MMTVLIVLVSMGVGAALFVTVEDVLRWCEKRYHDNPPMIVANIAHLVLFAIFNLVRLRWAANVIAIVVYPIIMIIMLFAWVEIAIWVTIEEYRLRTASKRVASPTP